MEKLAQWIIRFRILILTTIVVITSVLGYLIKDVKVNPDIYSYLPENDEVAQLFDRIGDNYGGNYIALVGVEADNVFTTETLRHISQLTDSLGILKGVSSVTSLVNILDIKGSDWGIEIGNLIDPYHLPQSPAGMDSLRTYIMNQDMYRGMMVSEDETLTLIMVKIQQGDNKMSTAEAIKELVLRQNMPETFYFGGLPFFMLNIQEIILNDLKYLAPLCLVIITMIMFAGFRNVKKVLIPILVVLISIIWTIGFMSLLKVEISIVSSVTPVVLIAVGSAYSIHVINRVNETLDSDRKKALQQALTYIIIPVFLAAITTIMGFLSFLAGSYLDMIRIFGLFTALGVFFALILSLTFAPCFLSYIKIRQRSGAKPDEKKSAFMNPLLKAINDLIITKHRYILGAWLVILLIGIMGSLNIERNVDIMDYFKKNSPYRRTGAILQEKLTGSYPVYVLVEGNMQDPGVLNSICDVSAYLETFDEIKHPQSLADLIMEMNEVMGEGKVIPDEEAKVQQLCFLLSGESIMEQMVSFDFQEGLITADFNTTDSEKMNHFVDLTDKYLSAHNTDDCRMLLTGSPSLYKKIEESLLSSQMQSLIYATILVLIIISLILRSIRLGSIGIVPILVTLTTLFGVMGFTGIPLDIATVLVGSISIGIGIDYSIHMIVHVNHALKNNLPLRAALEQSIMVSGKAVIINVLSVSAGFLILMFSDLIPLRHFGLLVAVTMITSGLGALTLIPSLLILKERKTILTNE